MDNFIRIGEFIVPIRVDNSLDGDKYYIISQAEVDEWIKSNPEKVRKLMDDAKRAVRQVINQSYSASCTVKGDKHE